MSNSRRKTPIIGMAKASSDKAFKKAEHSRERSAVRIALAKGKDPVSPRAFGDPCRSQKDGKQYVPGEPEYLRK